MTIKVTKMRQRSAIPSAAADESAAAPAWPLEQWLALQAELFRTAEPGLLGWIARRCEGNSAILQSLSALAQCRELGDIAAIQTDWWNGSLKRLERDLQAASDHIVALTQCVAGAAQRAAAQAAPEEMKTGAAWIVRKEPSPSGASVLPTEMTAGAGSENEAVWQSR